MGEANCSLRWVCDKPGRWRLLTDCGFEVGRVTRFGPPRRKHWYGVTMNWRGDIAGGWLRAKLWVLREVLGVPHEQGAGGWR